MTNSSATPILEVRDLVKHFKQVHAVNGLSFDVRPGTCFGLLGPNGAGKSTTIEICEGLLTPTAGTVRYKGEPLGPKYRERVGIQFQSTALQDHLTVIENLRFFSALYPVRRPIDELIALCRLEDFLDRDSKKLSGGQRQRLLLAIALVNDPELLFLDEPTTGLDPQARRELHASIAQMKRDGYTVLFTTHYLDEAEALCDRVAIIDRGRIVATGAPHELIAQSNAQQRVTLVTTRPLAFSAVSALPGVSDVKCEHAEIHFHTSNATESLAALTDLLTQTRTQLIELQVKQASLEDVFLRLTQQESGAATPPSRSGDPKRGEGAAAPVAQRPSQP